MIPDGWTIDTQGSHKTYINPECTKKFRGLSAVRRFLKGEKAKISDWSYWSTTKQQKQQNQQQRQQQKQHEVEAESVTPSRAVQAKHIALDKEMRRIKYLESRRMVPPGTSNLKNRRRALTMNAAQNHRLRVRRFIDTEAQEAEFRSVYGETHSIIRYSAITADLAMFTKSIMSMTMISQYINGFVLVAIPLIELKEQHGSIIVLRRGYFGEDATQGVHEIPGPPFNVLFAVSQTAPSMNIDTHLRQKKEEAKALLLSTKTSSKSPSPAQSTSMSYLSICGQKIRSCTELNNLLLLKQRKDMPKSNWMFLIASDGQSNKDIGKKRAAFQDELIRNYKERVAREAEHTSTSSTEQANPSSNTLQPSTTSTSTSSTSTSTSSTSTSTSTSSTFSTATTTATTTIGNSIDPTTSYLLHDVQTQVDRIRNEAEVKLTWTFDGLRIEELTTDETHPLKANGVIDLNGRLQGLTWGAGVTASDAVSCLSNYISTGSFGANPNSWKAGTTFSYKPVYPKKEGGMKDGRNCVYSADCDFQGNRGYGPLYHAAPASIQAVFDRAIALGVKVIKATICCHSEGSIGQGNQGYPMNQQGVRSDVNIHLDSLRPADQATRGIWGFVYKGLAFSL